MAGEYILRGINIEEIVNKSFHWNEYFLNHYNTIFNSEVSSNYSSEVTEEIKNDFLKMFPEQTIFVDLLLINLLY